MKATPLLKILPALTLLVACSSRPPYSGIMTNEYRESTPRFIALDAEVDKQQYAAVERTLFADETLIGMLGKANDIAWLRSRLPTDAFPLHIFLAWELYTIGHLKEARFEDAMADLQMHAVEYGCYTAGDTQLADAAIVRLAASQPFVTSELRKDKGIWAKNSYDAAVYLDGPSSTGIWRSIQIVNGWVCGGHGFNPDLTTEYIHAFRQQAARDAGISE